MSKLLKNPKLKKQLTVLQFATLCEALESVFDSPNEAQEEMNGMDYELAMQHLENYAGY